MAFDQGYKNVFEQFASIDSKINKDELRYDQNNQRDLLELQAKIGTINNPMNYLTPILIACLVIVAILASLCICGLGLCWYVRFNKKKRLERYPEDEEAARQNNVSLRNVNEEKIQFINNVYKTLKMREKQDSAESSEVNIPAAGCGFADSREDFTPIHTPSRNKSGGGWKSDRSGDSPNRKGKKCFGSPPKKTSWGESDESPDEKKCNWY